MNFLLFTSSNIFLAIVEVSSAIVCVSLATTAFCCVYLSNSLTTSLICSVLVLCSLGDCEISSTIFELSSMSRKEGLLGLDVEIDKLDNDYLKKGIRLVVDGTNGERVDYRRCAIYTSGRESSCREGKDKNISCKLGRKKCRIIQNNVSIMRQGYLL